MVRPHEALRRLRTGDGSWPEGEGAFTEAMESMARYTEQERRLDKAVRRTREVTNMSVNTDRRERNPRTSTNQRSKTNGPAKNGADHALNDDTRRAKLNGDGHTKANGKAEAKSKENTKAQAKAVPQEASGEQKASEIQGSFMLVREWTDERAAILAAFRREAQKHHPDKGGDPADFRRLVKWKDRALKSASERRIGPGVYFNDGKDEEPKWRWLCSQLEPLARTRGNDNRNWGKLLEVVDRDGVRHVWAMPARIGPMVGDGTDFRRELVDRRA